MADPLMSLSADPKEHLETEEFPRWLDPMLATLVGDPFSDESWVYERKLDGERCLALCQDHDVRLLSEDPPFVEDGRPSDAHRVRPKLVAEIGFTEWTSGGKLRHPGYIGLRDDKAPRDVVRETPK